MFFKIVVLKNFTNFIGKHLRWSLFSKRLQALDQAFRHMLFPASKYEMISRKRGKK